MCLSAQYNLLLNGTGTVYNSNFIMKLQKKNQMREIHCHATSSRYSIPVPVSGSTPSRDSTANLFDKSLLYKVKN